MSPCRGILQNMKKNIFIDCFTPIQRKYGRSEMEKRLNWKWYESRAEREEKRKKKWSVRKWRKYIYTKVHVYIDKYMIVGLVSQDSSTSKYFIKKVFWWSFRWLLESDEIGPLRAITIVMKVNSFSYYFNIFFFSLSFSPFPVFVIVSFFFRLFISLPLPFIIIIFCLPICALKNISNFISIKSSSASVHTYSIVFLCFALEIMK